jgi:hypothetical protein
MYSTSQLLGWSNATSGAQYWPLLLVNLALSRLEGAWLHWWDSLLILPKCLPIKYWSLLETPLQPHSEIALAVIWGNP